MLIQLQDCSLPYTVSSLLKIKSTKDFQQIPKTNVFYYTFLLKDID